MSSQETFLLSPLDQHGPRVYTRMALVFPVNKYDGAVELLQLALSKTCNALPYLKGKVFEGSLEERRQAYISLDSNEAPPQFQEILIPNGTPSFEELKFDRTPFPVAIFPAPAPKPEAGFEAPVLAASYTKIEGGLVVTIVIYHKVIDGSGYSEILRVLAENARTSSLGGTAGGLDAHDITSRRERLQGGKASLPDHVKQMDFDSLLARHPEYALKSRQSNIHGGAAAGTPRAGTGVNKVFAFSKRKLDIIKEALSGDLPAKWLTVNNILTALIWTSVTHIRNTRPGRPLTANVSKMDFSVSGRRLLGKSTLDPPYLGNCLGYALTELAIDELSFIPSPTTIKKLLPIITRIATATEKLDANHMYEIVHLSDMNPDLTDLVPSWFFNGPEDLHFTSWAQMGVYGFDFGPELGKPQYIRSAIMKFDGIVTLLPRSRVPDGEGDEAIEASILLKEEDMERLGGDIAWQGWLYRDTQ